MQRLVILLAGLLFSCSGGPAFFLSTSFEAPQTWSLVDEAGRVVEVSLVPSGSGVTFQAGVIREGWVAVADGYAHADTVELLHGGTVRSYVFAPFLVYPLPPLPGFRRESARSGRVIWGQDTLHTEEHQILEIQEGPVLHLSRVLWLAGQTVVEEDRRLEFEGQDLRAFSLVRVIQGDTLSLHYTQP